MSNPPTTAPPTAPKLFCEDCGQPVDAAGGTFELRYKSGDGQDRWLGPRNLCSAHVASRTAAKQKPRVPIPPTADDDDD